MKIKGILALTILASSFISAAYANIMVITPTRLMGDVCSEVQGNWNGKGTVDVVAFKCDYKGNGMLTIPSPGKLSFDVTLQRTGGPELCPKGQHFVLTGECHNGEVTFKTPDADLQGHLSEDGRSANDVHGKIYVTPARIPANVTMSLQKD